CKRFLREPEERFWEMYLALRLLDARRKLHTRAELTAAVRDRGPDICIKKCNRRIWIEATAPGRGDAANLDRIPDDVDVSAAQGRDEERRQVELRITSAIYTKMKKFQEYRDAGIIGDNDSCIVAISGAKFALAAVGELLPHAASAVYPFGDEQF